MDHCGYCTFFLAFLGVPTEQPTSKPSTTAGSSSRISGIALTYGIPDFIRTNSCVIRRLFNEDEDAVAEKFLEAFVFSLVEKQKLAAQSKLAEWREKKHSLAEVIKYIHQKDSSFLNEKLWAPFEKYLTEALNAYKPSERSTRSDSGAPAASSSSSTAPAPPPKT